MAAGHRRIRQDHHTNRYQNSGIKLNTGGFSADYEVYNVIRSDPNTPAPDYLQPFFGGGGGDGSGYICSSAAQAIVQADSFRSLSPNDFSNATCGLAEFYDE